MPKRHCMRNPGTDSNFFIRNINNLMMVDPPKNGIKQKDLRSIVLHFTCKLLENMTNMFPHIPDFAWISHTLPLTLPITQENGD